MKNTKHATTNFRRLLPLIEGMNGADHKRYEAPGFMPLVIEHLYDDVFSLTHYGEQNGDAMRDPDMELRVNMEAGTVEPLTFQNDYMGVFQEVYIYRDGKKLYSPSLRRDLDDFLWHWLQNIENQGYIRR